MPDLVTLDYVKSYLEISGIEDDLLLSQMISAESMLIEEWTSRSYVSASRTEKWSGTGRAEYSLKFFPVSRITSLTIDGQSIPEAITSSDCGYMMYEDRLYLIGYRFTRGVMNCSATYAAGYETIPEDIAYACIELIAYRFKDRERIGMVQKGLAGETTTYEKKAIPEHVKQILTQYKNVAVS